MSLDEVLKQREAEVDYLLRRLARILGSTGQKSPVDTLIIKSPDLGDNITLTWRRSS